MTATTPWQACPVCDSELVVGAAQCTKCKTDLRLFAPAAEIALDFYNEGLDFARGGDRQGAIEKMQAALAADPSLVDAYIVLGKLVAQAGSTKDLEQAILCWQRSRIQNPTDEQTIKLDHCTETAQTRLREAAQREDTKRRHTFLSIVAGGLGLAVAGGVLGYALRPGYPLGGVISFLGPSAATQLAAQPAPPAGGGTSVDPITAINEALQRPDITVARSGDRIVLQGRVRTDAEKKIVLAAAAYAAHSIQVSLDGSNLKVKPTYSPVAARQVERMLRVVIGGLGRNSSDPLHAATLSVSGGANKQPLMVIGTCTRRGAGAEIARLVKEVYPSANPVNASGLAVHVNFVPAIRRSLRVMPVVPLMPVKSPAAEETRVASNTRPVAAASPGDQVYINLSTKTYTVQPGDTIYAITHKYGRDRGQWQQLWQTNRDAIHNPNAIPAGTVLRLPPGWKPPKQALDENE